MATAEALERALDTVYRLVLTADMATLGDLEQETESLVRNLDPLRDLSTAERLRAKAGRNAACLQAALRGLRSAQRRMAEVDGPAARHSTYDRKGLRAEVGPGTGTLAQRL